MQFGKLFEEALEDLMEDLRGLRVERQVMM